MTVGCGLIRIFHCKWEWRWGREVLIAEWLATVIEDAFVRFYIARDIDNEVVRYLVAAFHERCK